MADPARPRQPRTLEQRALALLARREYARAELRERLLAAGAARDDVDATLERLAAQGYLSDDRYARAVVLRKEGGYSKRAIGAELRAKGVAAETSVAAVAEIDADDQATLVALWRRRFGRAPADDREKARQVRFLQSRGFSLSAILKLLRDPPAD
jgi:regulatory protein